MRLYIFWIFILSSIPFILVNPTIGIMIYSCMNIVRPELLFWGGHAASHNSMEIIILLTILGIFFQNGKINFRKLYNRELFLMLWIYLGAILSIVFSEYEIPRQYYYANELFKIFVLSGMVVLLLDSAEKLIKYERYLLYCILFLAIWGIDQHFRGNDRLEKLGGFDSNGIAAYFALFLPLAFSRAIEATNKKEKIISFAATASIILAIIFTQSRGGLLGLISGIAAYIYYSKKKMKIMVVIFVIFITASPFISDMYTKRMDTMTSEGSLGGSAISRLYLWRAGLMIFVDNPLIGTGLLSYPLEKFKYEYRFVNLDADFRKWLFRRQNPKVTHNTYIRFMSDCGLASALPFFLLLFGTFIANRKIRRKAITGYPASKLLLLLNGVECGIIGNCVSIFFIDANFMIFLYVQVAVCSAIRGVLNANDKSDTNVSDNHSQQNIGSNA